MILYLYTTPQPILIEMPRNRISDDVDHVPIDSQNLRASRLPPPEPWPLLSFIPREINNPLSHGQGDLPDGVDPTDAYATFSLFFNSETLQTLVNYTNAYAKLYPPPETPHART